MKRICLLMLFILCLGLESFAHAWQVVTIKNTDGEAIRKYLVYDFRSYDKVVIDYEGEIGDEGRCIVWDKKNLNLRTAKKLLGDDAIINQVFQWYPGKDCMNFCNFFIISTQKYGEIVVADGFLDQVPKVARPIAKNLIGEQIGMNIGVKFHTSGNYRYDFILKDYDHPNEVASVSGNAENPGMLAGDVILKINDVDVRKMSFGDLNKLISELPSDQANVFVLKRKKSSEPIIVRIKPDFVKVEH